MIVLYSAAYNACSDEADCVDKPPNYDDSPSTLRMRIALVCVFLLLCFYAVLAFNAQGEVLTTLRGKVERCRVLGGAESLQHATIKAENGSYLIASLEHCRAGAEVAVLIKRGALYFNTIYAAEVVE